jgi:hypothetical protein
VRSGTKKCEENGGKGKDKGTLKGKNLSKISF